MDFNRLKQSLSLLFSALLIFNLNLAPLAQGIASDESARPASPASGAAALATNDAISNFTARIPSESYDRVWQMTGPFGGDVAVLTIDPRNADRILIGTSDGQIYRSTDGGIIWKRLRPGIRAAGFIVTVIHFDRENPGMIYVGVKPQTDVGDGGGFFVSQDGGESWREIETMRGRGVRSFSQSASNPNVMSVAASSGVYRSSDRGNSWELITQTGDAELRGFHSVAIDPRDPSAIYVGTHHLPWKTLDGGKSWKRTGHKEVGMIDDSDIFTIQIDPDNPNVVMMSACSGIYRSRDAGTAWTKFQGIPYSSRRTHVIYRHPTRPETIFAGTTEGLWISNEDGKPDTWRRVTSLLLVINAIAIHPSQPDRVFLGTQDNGVLVSLDGGETFESSNAGFINRKVPAVLADSSERGRVYAGVIFDGINGGLFISEDGGITWQQSMNGMGVRDVYSLYQSPAKPETIYAGTNHGVFRSDDHGRNWTHIKREEPVEADLENAEKTADGKPAAVGKSPSTVETGNQANPSSRPRVITPQTQTSAKPVKPIVQTRAKQLSGKTGAGKTQANTKAVSGKTAGKNTSNKTASKKTAVKTSSRQKKKVEPEPKPVSDRVDLQSQVFAIIPFTARVEGGATANWLVASTWDGLFYTDDEKKGWKPFKIRAVAEGDAASGQPGINSIATSPHAPGVIYMGTQDGLFVSRDNGASFRSVEIDPDVKAVRHVVFDPRTAEMVYAGTSGGFFRSMDGGKSWEHRGGGMPQMVNVGALIVSGANPEELYLFDELRNLVFHSKDRGRNWDKMDISQLPSLKMLAMTGDPFDSNRLYAGSFSGGVYVMSRK